MPHTAKTIRRYMPTARRVARATSVLASTVRCMDTLTLRVQELEQVEAHAERQLTAAHNLHAHPGWLRLTLCQVNDLIAACQYTQGAIGYRIPKDFPALAHAMTPLIHALLQTQDKLLLCQ